MHFVKDILIMLSLWQEFLHKNICLKDSGRCHVEDVSWLLDREHIARSLDWSCLRTRRCGGKKSYMEAVFTGWWRGTWRTLRAIASLIC